MRANQRTIRQEVSIHGVGLHTGARASVVFLPQPENSGIVFQRVDLPAKPVIEAREWNVSDTSRGTTLKNPQGSVQTVEHLLAAAAGLEIDNLLIAVDGPEIPIMDGSSAPFVTCLKKSGILEQSAGKKIVEITEELYYRSDDGTSLFHASPYPTFRLEVEIDYNSQVLSPQKAVLEDFTNFTEDFASSRTFCFLHELEQLHHAGMIKGGDLHNAIVISERDLENEDLDHLASMLCRPSIPAQKAGILDQTPLRFANEPARHKLLDLVGDLSLLGHPIRGKISVVKPGHTANIAFVRMIREVINHPAGQNV